VRVQCFMHVFVSRPCMQTFDHNPSVPNPETTNPIRSYTGVVTSKVDVWSAGVVLYEMLYGTRPFAHNMTAMQIWKLRDEVWRKEVCYPRTSPVTKAPISAGARRFMGAYHSSVLWALAQISQLCMPDVVKFLPSQRMNSSSPTHPKLLSSHSSLPLLASCPASSVCAVYPFSRALLRAGPPKSPVSLTAPAGSMAFGTHKEDKTQTRRCSS
jgi:serine/threonine protein kinase